MTDVRTPLAILPALLAVKRELGAIPKDGVGPSSQGSYAFVQYDRIIEKLGELFQKHEIVVVPRMLNHETTIREAEEPWTTGDVSKGIEPRPLHNGKLTQINVREWVEMEYRFISAIDGSEVVGSISGEAMDSQDKASRKAHTSAYKSYLIIAFDIVTGEKDPDAINPEDSNRAAATDTLNRGQQHIAAARPGAAGRAPSQRPSVTTNPRPGATTPAAQAAAEAGADASTGEIPDAPIEPLAAPEPDRLQKAKDRVREANAILGLAPEQVNALATELTGKQTRAEWSVLPTMVEKIAKDLEAKVKAQSEGGAE